MLEFTPSEVGTHFVDVVVAGRRMSSVAKVYNSSLIRVLDVTPGVVGQTSQFKGMMIFMTTTYHDTPSAC